MMLLATPCSRSSGTQVFAASTMAAAAAGCMRGPPTRVEVPAALMIGSTPRSVYTLISTVDPLFAQPRIHAGQYGHRLDLLDPLEAGVVVAQTRFKNAGWNVVETPATGPVVEVGQHVTSDDDRTGRRIDQDTLKTDGVTGQGQRADSRHDL